MDSQGKIITLEMLSDIINIAAGIKIDEASLRVTEDELGAAYKNCEDHTPIIDDDSTGHVLGTFKWRKDKLSPWTVAVGRFESKNAVDLARKANQQPLEYPLRIMMSDDMKNK